MALSFAVTALSLASIAVAQVPLVSQRFNYANLPQKVDNVASGRGPQTGYNRCNSTTLGPTSQCQTAIINSVADFCLWGPPEPNSEVGSTEGEAVAWCTQPTHGTRVIPSGAITGVQFIQTSEYVQVTGFINQTLVNIAAGDFGGEMDSAGADQRGNPLGGIMFTQAFRGNTTANSNYTQVVHWTNFMGANTFCLKACDQTRPNPSRHCEHIYDRIGCRYNVPSSNAIGEFSSCQGAVGDFVGVYTGANGQVSTYQQPPESLGAISTIPYQPRVPSSSQCTTYASSQLFAAAIASSASSAAPSSAITSASSVSAASNSGATNLPSSTRPTGAAVTTTPSGGASGLAAPFGTIALVAGALLLALA